VLNGLCSARREPGDNDSSRPRRTNAKVERALAEFKDDPDAADKADAQHTARVLLQRSAGLGNLNLSEALVAVAPEVRFQCRDLRLPSVRLDIHLERRRNHPSGIATPVRLPASTGRAHARRSPNCGRRSSFLQTCARRQCY